MTARRFRAMRPDDVDAVVAIIADADEDDGEAAAADFAEDGVEGHFVVTLDDDVAFGVSGFRHVPATERTSWLSWTYLARELRGRGHGSALVDHTVERLREAGCRKAFVKVSDYRDPHEGAIYAAATKVYERLGFVRELFAADFYDDGENLAIHGRRLDGDDTGETPEIAEENAALEFVGFHEIADTDGAYTFEWSAPKSSLFGRLGRRVGKSGGFEREDLMLGLESVGRAGGRKVFLTFPSNLPSVREPLEAAGFETVGQLRDYYEPGLHELHFSHDLSGIA